MIDSNLACLILPVAPVNVYSSVHHFADRLRYHFNRSLEAPFRLFLGTDTNISRLFRFDKYDQLKPTQLLGCPFYFYFTTSLICKTNRFELPLSLVSDGATFCPHDKSLNRLKLITASKLVPTADLPYSSLRFHGINQYNIKSNSFSKTNHKNCSTFINTTDSIL